MNNSVNYSQFIDMLLDSSDDFEPYGLAEIPGSSLNKSSITSAVLEPLQYDDSGYD